MYQLCVYVILPSMRNFEIGLDSAAFFFSPVPNCIVFHWAANKPPRALKCLITARLKLVWLELGSSYENVLSSVCKIEVESEGMYLLFVFL